MSGSEEEVMDGLEIKPPQHVHRHKERKRDRSHKHPKSHRLKDLDEEERRQHQRRQRERREPLDVRGQHRQDRFLLPPGQMMQQQQQQEGHRSRKQYHSMVDGAEGGTSGSERTLSSSRRQHNKPSSSSRRNVEDFDEHGQGKVVRDKRSKDLREAQIKRRTIEMENERALRDIERRREQERGVVSEDSGGGNSSSRKHRRAERQKHYEDRNDDNSKEDKLILQSSTSPDRNKLETEELKEHINLEIEEIEESSSELEEGEERTPHPIQQFQEDQDAQSGKSDVSSASENEEEQQENVNKVTSDVSSSTSSSRKSDGKSDVSSSSSSSDNDTEESEHEDDQEQKPNGEDGPKPAKISRKDFPNNHTPPSPIKSKSSPVQLEKTESKGMENIPLVVITAEEEDDEEEKDLLPPYLPSIQGCRRVEEFQLLNRIEEGTYGVVYRAKDKRTDEIVALKRLKMEKEKDGFPITSLREINTLLKAQHENIVTVREIVVGSNTDKIFLVMDYVEHDMKALMETLKQKGQVFLPEEVKCLMIQLLRAVAHMHDNWILHRDLKTSNLLLSHKGILKVGDFGLAREYGSPLKQYTPIVVTLWYRSPELLLGTKEYSCPIDVWSVGCIFGELLKMEPMFPGKSEANQLNLIFQSLGTPNDRIWPGYSQLPLLQKITFADYPVNKLKTKFSHLTEQGIDLMNCFLKFNPAKRITSEEALKHAFFREAPLAIDPSMFPTWPAKSEMGHRKTAAASPKPPSGGQQFKGLKEDEDSSGFFLGGGDARRHNLGAGFSLKF